MMDPVSIQEAAKDLSLSPARVRVMAARGQLAATKIGNRWLVERAAIEKRRRDGAHEGRRFTSRNAWALLLLAAGEEVDGLDPSVRSRLKRALRVEGIERLGPRLGHRARLLSFRAHPGEIPYLVDDPALVRSGVSAAAAQDFDLVSGREADGYLQESKLERLVEQHALVSAGPDGNVRLRLVPDQVWPVIAKRAIAPRPAVALDLAEESDPRSAEAGRRVLRELDRPDDRG
jgi:excisionase family DNA binding protein